MKKGGGLPSFLAEHKHGETHGSPSKSVCGATPRRARQPPLAGLQIDRHGKMKMSARTAIIALASVAMLIHAANAAEIKRSAPKVSSNSNSNSQTAIDHDELFQRSQVESTPSCRPWQRPERKRRGLENMDTANCAFTAFTRCSTARCQPAGEPKTFSYSSCSQVVQSMLAYAHDVMHLISYGCYQYDPYKGWQTVKPCPAHVICGRLPNIYDQAKETMCPADYHFRFPHALASLAPKVSNPLLPYAIKQYTNNAKSSILQEANAPSQEPGKSITSMNAGLRGSAPASQSGYPSVRSHVCCARLSVRGAYQWHASPGNPKLADGADSGQAS